jgi:hypothetical protein
MRAVINLRFREGLNRDGQALICAANLSRVLGVRAIRFLRAPRCAGDGLLRCASSRCQGSASRPCRAVIPHALAEPHRALMRAGARRLRPVAWSVRSLANQAAPASLNATDQMNRLALPTWMGSAARSRDQGSRALSFTLRVNDPLHERVEAWCVAALLLIGPRPDRHPRHRQARCRAAEFKGATSTQKRLRLK